jgi:membrane protease YdiL (CAAX protease family)
MTNDKKALRLYLVLTFAVSMAIEAVWIYYDKAASDAGISQLLMFIPCIAALIVSKIYYKKQKILGFSRCKFNYLILSILLPLIYWVLSYCAFWFFSNGSFGSDFSLLISQAANYREGLSDNTAITAAFIIMIPICIITALGEEVGWRGFMYPKMKKLWEWKKAIIFSGVAWALWHLPLVVTELYYNSTVLLFRIPMFFIEIFALTIIISWLRVKSNSVWPAILFHASHNYFDQVIFQSFTNNVNSAYFVGETGIISVSVTVIAAVIVLVKFRNVFIRAEGFNTQELATRGRFMAVKKY